MSYELRTPLTTIIGYAELLERDAGGLAERERGYIAAVRAAASHLARSINDVLATAEIDAGETVHRGRRRRHRRACSPGPPHGAPKKRAAARVEVEVSIDTDFGLMSR